MSACVPREAIARMFDAAPRDWWRFVPCATCNARRQELCQTWEKARCKPHAVRYRVGLVLHGTLWLLANGFESDVLGVSDEPGESARLTETATVRENRHGAGSGSTDDLNGAQRGDEG